MAAASPDDTSAWRPPLYFQAGVLAFFSIGIAFWPNRFWDINRQAQVNRVRASTIAHGNSADAAAAAAAAAKEEDDAVTADADVVAEFNPEQLRIEMEGRGPANSMDAMEYVFQSVCSQSMCSQSVCSQSMCSVYVLSQLCSVTYQLMFQSQSICQGVCT